MAVIPYGTGFTQQDAVTAPAQLAAIRVPVLGLFGAEDPRIPVANVEAFESPCAHAASPWRSSATRA